MILTKIFVTVYQRFLSKILSILLLMLDGEDISHKEKHNIDKKDSKTVGNKNFLQQSIDFIKFSFLCYGYTEIQYTFRN